jgi:glucokinase
MTPPESALLADIGATNARFALLTGDIIGASATYEVADHASPIEAARIFLAGPASGHSPRQALIAAAGPVANNRVVMTNAGWTVDSERIRRGLDLSAVHVLNDFEALGWSLPALRPDDIATVGKTAPGAKGTMAVMGPGSGFGLAALAPCATGETVLVTEGGHATLSSENRREEAIIRAIREQVHHVSVERVLSGPGLVQLYHAIAKVDGTSVPERSSSEIVAHALEGDCKVSLETLELFCAFLGSVAGNIALTLGAQGGVFIGGGITKRFTDFLRRSSFRERFEAKGRMSSYLERIATAVIIHDYPAFLGLAYLARHSRGRRLR